MISSIGKWDSGETWRYHYGVMIISLYSLHPHNYLLKRHFIIRLRCTSTTPLDTLSPSHSCSPTPNIPFTNSRITSSSAHMPSAITPTEVKTPETELEIEHLPHLPAPQRNVTRRRKPGRPTALHPKGFIPRHSVTYVHRFSIRPRCVCVLGADGPAHERTNERTNERTDGAERSVFCDRDG